MDVAPISVIIPTILDRRELLDECLESISRSSLRPAEILTSMDLVKAGPAVVRNHLADVAQHDWLAFVDDDDLVLPHHFETLWKARYEDTLKIEFDVVYTRPHVEGRAAPKIGPYNRQQLENGNYIPVTAMVRKSLFRKVGGFPDARFEDWELWKALGKARAKFRYVPETTWIYRTIGPNRTQIANAAVAKARMSS